MSSNTLDSCALLNSSGSVVQNVSDVYYHDCEENLPAVEKTIDYDTLVATFLLELREIKKALGVACEFVAQRFVSLLGTQNASDSKIFLDILLSNGVGSEHVENHLNISGEKPLLKAFEQFQFQTTLNSYVSQQAFFVSPIEINAGFNEELQRNESFQYVPLFDNQRILLSKDYILQHVLDPIIRNDGVICSFRDRTVFKDNPLFSINKRALQINIYSDEFTCSNPLGNKTSKYKVVAFYFSLGNLPRKKGLP